MEDTSFEEVLRTVYFKLAVVVTMLLWLCGWYYFIMWLIS